MTNPGTPPAHRVILITGASSGIGAATARLLAGSARLVLVARRREQLAEVVRGVVESGGEAHGIVADLAEVEVPIKVVDQAVERFGTIDALVNNAGLFATAAIGAIASDQLDLMWRLNVRAPLLLTQAALPHLRGRQGGTIVNVSSHAATEAFTGCGAYCASKAALEAWSRVLREELRGTNVRVGIVAPGATDTAAWPATTSAAMRARMCRPDDVAQAIRWVLDAPATASIDRLVVMPPGGAL
jgi:NADP-dependent 3-hydroxy acid dehydrogenase YdfG